MHRIPIALSLFFSVLGARAEAFTLKAGVYAERATSVCHIFSIRQIDDRKISVGPLDCYRDEFIGGRTVDTHPFELACEGNICKGQVRMKTNLLAVTPRVTEDGFWIFNRPMEMTVTILGPERVRIALPLGASDLKPGAQASADYRRVRPPVFNRDYRIACDVSITDAEGRILAARTLNLNLSLARIPIYFDGVGPHEKPTHSRYFGYGYDPGIRIEKFFRDGAALTFGIRYRADAYMEFDGNVHSGSYPTIWFEKEYPCKSAGTGCIEIGLATSGTHWGDDVTLLRDGESIPFRSRGGTVQLRDKKKVEDPKSVQAKYNCSFQGVRP